MRWRIVLDGTPVGGSPVRTVLRSVRGDAADANREFYEDLRSTVRHYAKHAKTGERIVVDPLDDCAVQITMTGPSGPVIVLRMALEPTP